MRESAFRLSAPLVTPMGAHWLQVLSTSLLQLGGLDFHQGAKSERERCFGGARVNLFRAFPHAYFVFKSLVRARGMVSFRLENT